VVNSGTPEELADSAVQVTPVLFNPLTDTDMLCYRNRVRHR